MKLIDKCKILELFEGLDVTGIIAEGTELKDLREIYWTADDDNVITYIDDYYRMHYVLVTSKVLRNEYSDHMLCTVFEKGKGFLVIFDCALYVNDLFKIS